MKNRIKWGGEEEERYYRELHWLKFEKTPLEYFELINIERIYNEQYWEFLNSSGEFGRRGCRIKTSENKHEFRKLINKTKTLKPIKEGTFL